MRTVMRDSNNISQSVGLERLRDELRKFAIERDWDQFHSPKNLAAALAVEAAELLEPFQWLTEAQSRSLSAKQKQAVQSEMADVLLYLVRLADKLDGVFQRVVSNFFRCCSDDIDIEFIGKAY